MDVFQLRIIVGLVMLSVSSGLDIWKREIHDFYWLVFGAITVIISVLAFDQLNIATLFYSLIIVPIALVLWRLGLFGGADAFALIVLAGLCPMATLSNSIITPFTTLSNAALLIVVPISWNLARNGISILQGHKIFDGFDETRVRKIFASMIGHQSKNPRFSFSIEHVIDGKKKFLLQIHNAETAEFCTTPNTWITQGVPYLLLISGGFCIQLLYGDIIFGFILRVITI